MTCPVPVIIAGGKKIPEKDALTMTYNAIKSGAAGVDMGRNIWQSENPVPMIRAVRAIVHSNYTIEQAYKMYTDLCKNPNKPTDKNNVKKQFKGGNPNKNRHRSRSHTSNKKHNPR